MQRVISEQFNLMPGGGSNVEPVKTSMDEGVADILSREGPWNEVPNLGRDWSVAKYPLNYETLVAAYIDPEIINRPADNLKNQMG